MTPTPFNPNPCGSAGPSTPSTPAKPTTPNNPAPNDPTPSEPAPPAIDESTVPDDFLLAYGPTPKTGASFSQRKDLATFNDRFNRFIGLSFAPDQFANVSATYALWGLGEPVFFQDSEGYQVSWPDAPSRTASATVINAVSRPDAVVATWQTQSVLRGGAVAETHGAVPAEVAAANAALQGGSPVGSGQAEVLTFGSSNAALALNEARMEAAAWYGSVPGLLTRPAEAGAYATLFATGLAGASEVSVTVGGITVAADELAIAETAPGLFALSIRVPDATAAGFQPVTVTADGVSTPSGPYLSILRP